METALPDAFTELNTTNNQAIDLAAMKRYLLDKVALYDSRDNFLKILKRGSKDKPFSINLSEMYYDASTEALHNIDTYAINRTTRNLEARMPDELFKAMSQASQLNWTKIPEATRMVLVKLLTNAKKAPTAPVQTRRAYMQDFVPSSEFIFILRIDENLCGLTSSPEYSRLNC